MPNPASTRLALIGPVGADAVAQGDDIIRAIITQLEAVGAGYIVDVIANRPTAATANKGYVFIATDAGVSFSTGSAWLDVQPLDSDLTAIAALTTTTIGRSLLAAADAAALRTILALGTAATSATSAFDAAGAAAAAQAASQPLDSDLTAIAALATTSFGRSVLTQADAAALRTLAGAVIGTNVQAWDADLDAIAALATTTFGRSLLTQATAAAALATLGTDASTASRPPNGSAGGDLNGTYPNPGVAKVAGKAVNKFNFGRTTLTMTGTASAGAFHVPHGFGGTTPLAVTLTVEDPTNAAILATLGTLDSTNFDVYLRDVRGLGNSNSYVVDWVAYA